MIVEIFITCWLIILPTGDAHCYCEGETLNLERPAVTREQPVEASPYSDSVTLTATH